MGSLLDWLIENEPSFRKSRLPSLYSDLSVQKAANPEGYEANVTAWQSALMMASLAGKLQPDHKLVLYSSNELLNTLASSQYGRPSGLGLVLDDSVRSGKMLDWKDFMNSTTSICHQNWIPSPWAVVRWGLRRTGLFGGNSYDVSGQLRNGQLVMVAALEELSKQVMIAQAEQPQGLTNRLQTRENFLEMLKTSCNISLSKEDEQVLLKFMARDKELLVFDDRTVKFKSPSSTTPEPLTQEDSTIASLKSLTSSLESQISELEKRLELLRTRAMTAVQNKNKQVALSALKSKKVVEHTLQQRSNTLHQVEAVFAKIEEAVDQVQLVQVMQSSAATLKNLNKQTGGVEKVEDIVEDLREQMTQVDEIGQVLQEPLDSNAVVDETEIDDELETLERESRQKQEQLESEDTRKRLAVLDRVGEQQKQAQDHDLKASIEKLEKLNIAPAQPESSNSTERVPEQYTA